MHGCNWWSCTFGLVVVGGYRVVSLVVGRSVCLIIAPVLFSVRMFLCTAESPV